MKASTRNVLNQVRLIGGAVAFAALIWTFIDPTVRQPIDIRAVLYAVFGLPAGAAALVLQIHKKSEI
jgi:hypothetical protein